MNKGGTLVIPEGIRPIRFEDDEIGRQFVVLSTAYLYANPPSVDAQQIINDQNSEIKIEYFGRGAEIFPAHLVEKNHNLMIGITGQVEAGEIVLAREVPGDSTVMQVATFEKIGKAHADMPETGEGIVIKNKGYVLKSQLRPDHSNAESFSKPLLNPLRSIFPHDNLLDDVHQHKFGDCFLLASVLAILNQDGGADYIKSMMIQKGESTVVKLYDPNEKAFVYYEISNSYHQKAGQNSVLHKAPWVHILEKAYTAHAYKKNSQTQHDDRKFVPTFPSFSEVYGSGGHPDVALTILTGSSATEHLIKSAINIPWEPENLFYCLNLYNKVRPFINEYTKEEIIQIDHLLSEISKDANGIKFLLRYIRGNSSQAEYFTLEEKTESMLFKLYKIISPKMNSFNNGPDADAFMYSFGEYVAAYDDLSKTQDLSIVRALSNVWNMAQLGRYFVEDLIPSGNFEDFMDSMAPNAKARRDAKVPRLAIAPRDAYARSTFHNFLRVKPKPPQDIVKAFEKFLLAEGYAQRWDSELGTGIYSDESLAVFAEISNHLSSHSEHKAIVASAKFEASDDGQGLRSQHAYAVIGTTEKTINGKALKFIKVRNPWGHTGRVYDWNRREGIARESNSEMAAISEIELSDFMRYFYKYTVGQYEAVPVQTIEVTNNINDISLVQAAVIGLIIACVIGIPLAITVSLIFLPIIVGLSLMFSTFFITASLLGEKADTQIINANPEQNTLKQKNSPIMGKLSTAQLIEKFKAKEEVISRGGAPLPAVGKSATSSENLEPPKSNVAIPQGCAVEAGLSFDDSSLRTIVTSV